MSRHGVLIDTSTRVVMLREPDSKEAFLVFPRMMTFVMLPMLFDHSLWQRFR